jgi:hypothetical protein
MKILSEEISLDGICLKRYQRRERSCDIDGIDQSRECFKSGGTSDRVCSYNSGMKILY